MRRALTLGAAALALAAGTARAAASSFTVNPIKIVLSDQERSTLLTVQNQSSEPLRFQVSVNGWSQSLSGEMQLSQTKDIVVFPSILTLAPGETRKLRVGAAVATPPSEKSYRIFVEELPPLQSMKKATSSQVRVLTKMGVPVFVSPTGAVARAAVDNLSLAAGKVAFDLKNAGTAHFVAGKIVVRALGAAGEEVHSSEVQGWYILAGTARHFEVPLPRAACGKARSVRVDVEFDKGAASGKLDARPEGCGP